MRPAIDPFDMSPRTQRTRRAHQALAALVGLCLAVGVACGDSGGAETETDATTSGTDTDGTTTMGGPAFGSDEDVQMANAIWAEIGDYSAWGGFTGKEGFQMGAAPHGVWQQIFLNEAAAADMASLADGSIIVKNNYTEELDTALESVTLMKKVAGFDPDTGDWFYAKYDPDGALLENPDGIPLAGLVGKGGESGCIPCHTDAPGGDYVFLN